MVRAVGALEDACRWPLAGLSDHGKEMAPLGAPSASSAFFCRLPRRRPGDPMPPPLVLWRTPAVGRWRGYLTTARRWRPWERRAPARHSFAVCPVGAPEEACRPSLAPRRPHAAAVGALGVACRWPLAGLSDHGKEMAPLGAPSANSAFFCRLPRRRSGGGMPSVLGAPETPCRRRWCFGGRLPLAVGGVI